MLTCEWMHCAFKLGSLHANMQFHHIIYRFIQMKGTEFITNKKRTTSNKYFMQFMIGMISCMEHHEICTK